MKVGNACGPQRTAALVYAYRVESTEGATMENAGPKSYKTTARVAGVLYIIATVAIIASGPFVSSTDTLDFLTDGAAAENRIWFGTILQLAWVLSVMFIPVVLYPVLKRYSETGALGFFSLRFTEAILSLAYVVIQLTMLSLSMAFIDGGGEVSAFETSGRVLLEARDWAFAMGAGLAFNLSALLLNYLLYRSKLVPRWLSVWGLIGAGLWMIVWFPQVYGVDLGAFELAFLPIGLQEMVFAVYLIVRGFDSTAIHNLTTTPHPSAQSS